MTTAIEIGRMLRAGTTGFVVGCRVDQLDIPEFGALVLAPLEENYQVYGMIHDIRVDDDGLVRQLAAAPEIQEHTIADNRLHRNVPVEISVLCLGFSQDGEIKHLLPPRPPLSLDAIYRCSRDQVQAFTGTGRFGYFRHLLRADDLPLAELFSAHLLQADRVHRSGGDSAWTTAAIQEVIRLLRDDYETLMTVLSALGDALGEEWEPVDESE